MASWVWGFVKPRKGSRDARGGQDLLKVLNWDSGTGIPGGTIAIILSYLDPLYQSKAVVNLIAAASGQILRPVGKKNTCRTCGDTFPSRSQLFKHIQHDCGTADHLNSHLNFLIKNGASSTAIHAYLDSQPRGEMMELVARTTDSGDTPLHLLVRRVARTKDTRALVRVAQRLIKDFGAESFAQNEPRKPVRKDPRDEAEEDVKKAEKKVKNGPRKRSRTSVWHRLKSPEEASYIGSTPKHEAYALRHKVPAMWRLLDGDDDPFQNRRRCDLCSSDSTFCRTRLHKMSGCRHWCCRDGLRRDLVAQHLAETALRPFASPVLECPVCRKPQIGAPEMALLPKMHVQLMRHGYYREHGYFRTSTMSGDGRLGFSGGFCGTVNVRFPWRGPARLWRLMSKEHSGSQLVTAASYNGGSAISYSPTANQLIFWNPLSNRNKPNHTMVTLSQPPKSPHTASVAMAANGITAASTVSSSRTVLIWNVPERKWKLELRGHRGAVTGLALSSDGAIVMSSSEDGTCKVWSTESGALIRTFTHHLPGVEGGFRDCAMSADGCIGLSCIGSVAVLWSIQGGEVLRVFKSSTRKKACLKCHISANGRVAVTAHQTKAIVWSTETGRKLYVTSSHGDSIAHVTLSADAGLVLTAATNLNAKLHILGGTHPVKDTTHSVVLRDLPEAGSMHQTICKAIYGHAFWGGEKMNTNNKRFRSLKSGAQETISKELLRALASI